MALDLNAHVADLAIERPGRIPVLEAFGLDYCCGGKRPLEQACRAAGLDPHEVAAALERGDRETDAAGEPDSVDWSEKTLAELIDDIVTRHHHLLRRELPRLTDLVARVREAHGDRHPELTKVGGQFAALRAELESHMAKEENILFPLIREMEATRDPAAGHCGSVANPIGVMEMEHDQAGEALQNLRTWTDGYRPPEDACPTYRALLSGLADLERDLHLHIHKENNLLHPRALELEGALRASRQ
jgi:regulator of cell morphogenesis and NO signaling